MTKIDPQALTRDKRDLLLTWLQGEELDPAEIVADKYFNVHGGVVRGYRYLKNSNGKFVVWNGDAVRVFFRHKQKNPLPPELQ